MRENKQKVKNIKKSNYQYILQEYKISRLSKLFFVEFYKNENIFLCIQKISSEAFFDTFKCAIIKFLYLQKWVRRLLWTIAKFRINTTVEMITIVGSQIFSEFQYLKTIATSPRLQENYKCMTNKCYNKKDGE